MFDPSTLPRRAGQLLLVTDKATAPAEFIILNILASHLKQATRSKSKCLLVSFSETISHWNSVAARLSPPINLTSQASKGLFVFVDALSGHVASSSTASLRPLYDKIYEILKDSEVSEAGYEQENLLILDGLSMVEWSGTPTSEAKRFIRALRALCHKLNATLVIRHHRAASNDLDNLTRALLSQCALHIEVLPLTSGRSGTISGEIALHVGPLLEESNSVTSIQRSAAVQYRLRDSGPLYFGRGTSTGIL